MNDNHSIYLVVKLNILRGSVETIKQLLNIAPHYSLDNLRELNSSNKKLRSNKYSRVSVESKVKS